MSNPSTKIAVVTGANRGLGLESCRQLAQQGITVILTSRDSELGESACEALQNDGLLVYYRQLDVTDPRSISNLGKWLEHEYGQIDILINNAGIFADSSDDHGTALESELEPIRRSFETNTLGPLQLCQELIPLMKQNGYGRIVNLSSGMGQLAEMNGSYPGYRISKTALNAVTRMFADELKGSNIKINSVCPGWVRTDMGGPNADRSVEKGVETIIWLATLDDDGPSGGFFRDKQSIPW